ncbi:antitoxin VbhA family protein [Sinorhizobium meliloti]|uniref:antitoxin VbhA family protein n=1 Tax=Rhizobium meliloti TaxID=382 RepID=UPI003D6476C7
MSRKPFDPTPEQIVADAVANSRLSGHEVPEDVQAVMSRIARGEMSADQVEAWWQEQASRIPPNEGMPSEKVFEQLMAWDREQTKRIARIRAEHGLPPEEEIGRRPE